MPEKKKLLTNHNIGYFVAIVFLFGAFIRVFQLGENPLDNHEAEYALQAFDTAVNTENGAVKTDPFLVLSTAVLFHFFSPSNFAARLLPAVMGSLLILIPLCFRQKLTPIAVLILSIGLALEPSLVAMSRVADSHIITLSLFSFWLLALVEKKSTWIGVLSGLLLLSGPNFGFLLLVTVLLFLWDFLSNKKLLNFINENLTGVEWRQVLITGGVTFLAGGTLFLFRADSVSAAFMGLAVFIQGWVEPVSSLNISHIGIILLAYEPFVVVFGIWGLIATQKAENVVLKNLLRWIILTLVVLVLYPSRSAGDLIWITVPLWVFASLNFDRLITSIKTIDWIHAGGFSFLCVLLGFILLNWVSIFNHEFDQQQILLRWILIAGSAILILLVTFMLNYGWGLKHGSSALVVSIAMFLFVFSLIPAMWNSAFLGNHPSLEFWRLAPYPSQLGYFKETVDDLSEWNHGGVGNLEIVSAGIDDTALQWILRDYTVEYLSALAPGAAPEAILTSINETGLWSASYTGQDFAMREYANWSLLIPREWQQWLVHRNIESTKEMMILWVRTDLFPGSILTEVPIN